MKITVLITILLFAAGSHVLAEPRTDNPLPQADAVKKNEPKQDCRNEAPDQNSNEAPKDECLPRSAFSTHKTNYLSFFRQPFADTAQVKYQFSAKYKVLNQDVDLWGGQLAGYFAYTQKSFWSIGEPSRPFQESNYNPEAFLSYAPELRYGRFKLHEIRLSPYEHESNGREGVDSRSWNRRYAQVRLGLGPAEPYRRVDAFTPDRAELDFKAWHAFAYYEQNDYLRTIGLEEDFLDYAGKSEVRLKLRNIVPWRWDNQLDLSTRLFRDWHKDNYQVEFQQNIPALNFSLYLQYWGGYDESLLRFERLGRKFYVGFSFCY